MTNRELLIHDLQHQKAGEPTGIVEYIECPYWIDEDCINYDNELKVGSAEYEENCRQCKADWLEKEWDG